MIKLGSVDFATGAELFDRLTMRTLGGSELRAAILRRSAHFAELVSGAKGAVIVIEGTTDPAFVVDFLAAKEVASVCVVEPTTLTGPLPRLLQGLEEWGYSTIFSTGGVLHITTKDAQAKEARSGSVLLLSGGTTSLGRLHSLDVTDDALRGMQWALARAGWNDCSSQLVVCPVYHAWGLLLLLAGLSAGQRLIFQGTYSPRKTLESLAEKGIDFIGLTPIHMRQLVGEPEYRRALRAVRCVAHSGAPCEPWVKLRWMELIGPGSLVELYSSTEQAGMTVCIGSEWMDRPGTVGKGFFCTIKIRDGEGRELSPNEIGAVYMRSSRQSATAGDGYRTVGDLGHLDEDGFLYLQGRADDMFLVGGENVYPAQVEAALLQIPGISQAMVFPEDHPQLVNSVCALVVLAAKNSTSPAEILKGCRSLLPRVARPTNVRIVEELPRTRLGKIDRTSPVS